MLLLNPGIKARSARAKRPALFPARELALAVQPPDLALPDIEEVPDRGGAGENVGTTLGS